MADKKITDLPSAPEAHSADLLIADQDKGGGALETRKLTLGQVRQWLQSLFDGRFLRQSKNLSDLTSASDARTNLDLGTAATKNVGTGNDDVPQNKDLGTAATKNVGTGDGDVPQNKDLGTAATKNTDTSATPDTVPLRDADGRIKAAVPSANDDVVTKGYGDDKYAQLSEENDFDVMPKVDGESLSLAVRPIGSTYIQFPDCSSPSDLFGGTWTALFESEGVFFRTPGGDASAFESGIQGDAIRNITGTIAVTNGPINGTHMGTDKGSGAFRPLATNTTAAGSNGADVGGRNRGISFDASRKVPTASENRPKNRTIRVWERTA